MSEAPLWSVLVLPVVAGAVALAGAGFDAALAGRAAGRPPIAAAADPLRDVARLLVQRRRVTLAPDLLLWRTGLALVPVAALMAALVVPLGGHVVSDLPVGVVWFNAMEVLVWAALWMAGWGANSAHPLVGGYRFVAQGLAYELPHMFALTTAALAAGSLSVGDIAADQGGVPYAAWMPVAFLVFLVSAAAMAARPPFDAPLHPDVAGGVAAEPSGADRLLLLAGRHLMLAVAALASVALFLGGGSGPLLPGWAWSLLKGLAVLAVLVWAGRRVPTVRMDRFTEVAWVVLVPLTILQALVVAVVVLLR
jgi:NADH-quinone oxidoreductase subunit H